MRLTPAGGGDRIDGRASDSAGLYLRARVAAIAADGKANAALIALIAKALGVAKSNISIARGGASRMKVLKVEGVSESEIAMFVAKFEERS